MIRENGFYTNDFITFWKNRVLDVNSDPLIISGMGFDPRSSYSTKLLLENNITPDILPIDFFVESSITEKEIIEQAINENKEIFNSANVINSPLKINMFDLQNRPVGGRNLVNQIYNCRHLLSNITDIMVDIGGLPRALFAPLLSYLITEQNQINYKNLHVASLSDDVLDNQIISSQILEPSYLYGFKRPTSNDSLVWIPIIGKNDPVRIRNIHNKIEKNCIEICPIIQFRYQNPRNVDDLIFNLKDLLFQEIRIFNSNIIYIAQESPFGIYREILQIYEYYDKLLIDLPGDVAVLITPIDDKTSSVGAIVAAVEKNLSIMYAETVSYTVIDTKILSKDIDSEPLEIWISGEAYEDYV